MKHPVVKIISCDGHSFWVKKEFLNKCPKPVEWWAYDLVNTYNLTYYLHREDGPAIESSNTYWYNGSNVSKEQHNRLSFTSKLENIIDE